MLQLNYWWGPIDACMALYSKILGAAPPGSTPLHCTNNKSVIPAFLILSNVFINSYSSETRDWLFSENLEKLIADGYCIM